MFGPHSDIRTNQAEAKEDFQWKQKFPAVPKMAEMDRAWSKGELILDFREH